MRFYNVAWLQIMAEFQHGKAPNMVSSVVPNMGYPIFEDFEESAQAPTVRFNIQPGTQPKEFSDLQLTL
jgi:hypothetical protein